MFESSRVPEGEVIGTIEWLNSVGEIIDEKSYNPPGVTSDETKVIYNNLQDPIGGYTNYWTLFIHIAYITWTLEEFVFMLIYVRIKAVHL